jgi:hypothetical protein
MRSLAAVLRCFRRSIELGTPLVCPRCHKVRRRVSPRESRVLIAGLPLEHRRCGVRYVMRSLP